MLIVWGTNSFDKTLGQTGPQYRCGHCNNVSKYKIFRRRKWFTLFWIPCIPLGSKYFVTCPVCNYGKNVPKQEALDAVEQVKLEAQLPQGQLPQNPYQQPTNPQGQFQQPQAPQNQFQQQANPQGQFQQPQAPQNQFQQQANPQGQFQQPQAPQNQFQQQTNPQQNPYRQQ